MKSLVLGKRWFQLGAADVLFVGALQELVKADKTIPWLFLGRWRTHNLMQQEEPKVAWYKPIEKGMDGLWRLA